MRGNNLFRVVWKISLPIIFLEGIETLDHLINTAFMARVGVTELAAVAVADSVIWLFLVLPLAFVDGLQILTARRAGQGRPEAVGAVFNQGLLIVLFVCFGLTIALKLCSPMVAAWCVESEAVGNLLDGYLQIEAYGLCLTGATFAYSALLTSLGRTGALIPATIILVVADIALNYLFVFGKFGFPQLGMRGAAIGTVGAELLTFLFLTLYVWRRLEPLRAGGNRSRYEFFRFRRFERRVIRLLGTLSGPIVLEGFVQTLRWFIFFLLLERVSTEKLAIANIVYTCYIVFWIPTEGFSETTCSMVGRLVGRNCTNRIARLLRHAIAGSILATIPFLLVALIVPEWLIAVFSPAPELLAPSAAALRVAAVGMLVAIPGEIWISAVMGTGDTPAVFGIELTRTLIMLALVYVTAVVLHWSVALIWLSCAIAWLIGLAFSYTWMRSGFWKRLGL
jgi:MATE family multidrug resistance protein